MSGFDHFDFIAPFYAKNFRSAPDEEFLKLAAVENGTLVLDAAGGTGRVAQHLSAAGARVVIQDASQRMLQQAAGKDSLRPARSYAERLPFAGGVFTRVIMVDAFHHLTDHTEAAAELYRVLAPGGRLIVEEPDIRNFYVKLIAVGEKLLLMRSHFLGGERIAAFFRPLGAQVEVRRKDHTVWVVIEKPA